ncbi:Glycosyltransferase involved in cell wall bisynthesis [Halovenus aranensis]|uniref:Glycosyltransferase involved in cell wall bisynthesis n=1 Tax=Halovenus aranensis TaxID=890420 RepID=A0A1G9A4E5_9EURY|nr:glycosyltransferase family 4 protein [Halovenus aranensis]SDK21455.1 Glycosyltransferase involved in cell wall bisynthesis [Halovenus aranensis]
MGRHQINALTTIINTKKDRGGAVRVGLKLGDVLGNHVQSKICKMESPHDQELFSELSLNSEVISLPQVTALKQTIDIALQKDLDLTNVLILTRVPSNIEVSEYDIVHLHNPIPLAAMIQMAIKCKRAGVPYCITTHGISKLPDTPDSEDLSRWQIPFFEYCFFKPYLSVLKNAAHLFALSEHDKQLLLEHFPEQSVSVTPNGVELNPPEGNDIERAKQEFQIPKDKPILLFVGKIHKGKGIDDLIAIHKEIQVDHRTIVAGQPEDQRYVNKIESTEDSLEYVGYTTKSQLKLLYRRADIFVFPTRTDVFPLVVLEAMAAGTPVVSTTVGGIPEQVTSEVGILTQPNDPEEMAERTTELLKNETRLQQLSQNAYERIKANYTWNTVARQVAEEYRTIIR